MWQFGSVSCVAFDGGAIRPPFRIGLRDPSELVFVTLPNWSSRPFRIGLCDPSDLVLVTLLKLVFETLPTIDPRFDPRESLNLTFVTPLHSSWSRDNPDLALVTP